MEGDWRKLKPSMGQAMSHILQTGLYTDTTFRVGPTAFQINVHRAIVMSRSEVFAVMLQDRWNENSAESARSVIDIPDASPNCFSYLIKYFYTDEVDALISITDRLELLRLAHMYQVPGLILECYAFLKSKISVDNCVQIFQGTRLYQEDKVLISQMAYDFLTKNIKDVVAEKEFLHLDQEGLMQLLRCDSLAIDEIELFKAVMRWTKQEVPPNVAVSTTPRKEALQSLIPLIRFPLMGAEAFAKEVVPTNVLSSDQALKIFLHFNGVAEGVGFSAVPRSPPTPPTSTFKRLQCYADQIALPTHELERFIPHTLADLQFRFRCTKGMTIHGLCFYGPDSSSLSSNSEYEIQFTISSLLYSYSTSGQNEVTTQVEQPGDFDVLLSKPLEVWPNVDYSVILKVKVHDLLAPGMGSWSYIESIFRLGKQPHYGNRTGVQVSVIEDEVGLRITYPDPTSYPYDANRSYGMIQSILYTL